MKNEDHTTLSDMLAGENGTISALDGGRYSCNRLVSLGLTPGAHVDITQNYGRGPVIVTVRGTMIALGRGEASQIIVTRS